MQNTKLEKIFNFYQNFEEKIRKQNFNAFTYSKIIENDIIIIVQTMDFNTDLDAKSHILNCKKLK
jgi:hypothetical protein